MFRLFISDFVLVVALGCTEKERETLSKIKIDITVTFQEKPLGCVNDSLSDVVCYESVLIHLSDSFEGKTFHLIEHLSQKIFAEVKTLFPLDKIEITIKKNPPIVSEVGFVSFTYSE